MRTTIDIPDATYRRLKARDADESPVTLPLVRSRQPGTLRLDNARIYDVISFP